MRPDRGSSRFLFREESDMRLRLLRPAVPTAVKMMLVVFALAIVVPAVAQAAEWAPNTAYAVGALVTYQGPTYKCLQAHTSLVGWEPPNTPSLWALQSGTSPTPTPTPR